MSDRTKLLKKAVMTGVGGASNMDRVKKALEEAMQDLVKVGHDLMEDLEEKGKVKTESTQSFLRGFQDEAAKRTGDIEKKVSAKLSKNLKKAAKGVGIVTYEQYEELLKRLDHVENHIGTRYEAPVDTVDVEASDASEDEHHEEGENGNENGKKKKNKKAE